jgi:hypothetical protein
MSLPNSGWKNKLSKKAGSVKTGGKQTLKMETTYSLETLVHFQQTTQSYVPEERLLITTAVRTSNPI